MHNAKAGIRRYTFSLAERLGMTVAELDERLTAAEFSEWVAFDNVRAQERDAVRS